MEFEKCRDILLQETALVRRIACLQERIKESVINRDWTDFENYFSVLAEIGDEFLVLENDREQLFYTDCPLKGTARTEDRGGHKGRFYAFAVRFPDERRNELTEIYRNLKLETLKVQTTGEALTVFFAGAQAALAGLLEIAFPERGGKIYTPRGRPVAHDMRSMVLNRAF